MTTMFMYSGDGGRMSERVAEELRQQAAAMIPTLTAQFPDKLAEYRRAHDADVAGYNFECKRHGDFLAVFMQRGPLPDKRERWVTERKIAQTINLGQTKTIGIAPGAIPDMTGRLKFCVSGADAAADWMVPSQNFPMIQVQLPVVDPNTYFGSMVTSNREPFGDMHLPDAPHTARDDTLNFHGIGVSIFAPAGMGQQIYDTILRELGAEFRNQSA